MRHSRPEGLEVIGRLSRLGAALGYAVHQEHRVGRSAAVDLSWTAANSNDVPLFVFEVESTASTGLANNALKVFGSPLDELAKPLFFFHIVLSGRADNERIRNAQLNWGQHNYRVYRLADEGQARLLAMDVLRQHRRVNRYLDPLAVADALGHPGWGGVAAITEAMTLAETLRFDGPYCYSYARMSMEEPAYLKLFARRVRSLDELATGQEGTAEPTHLSHEGYRGGPGDYVPGLLETGLRVYAGDLTDQEGPAAFEKWANRSGYGLRTVDAAFGLSRDYDTYVMGVAPLQYALTASLLTGHPRSRDWVMRDVARLVEGERECGLHPRFRLPAVLWLAHTIAAAFNADEAAPSSVLDLEGLYSDLQAHAAEGDGVPAQSLLNPPGPFDPFGELPEWVDDEQVVPLPPLAELRETSLGHARTGQGAGMTPMEACLNALLSEELYAEPGSYLLPVIYAGLLAATDASEPAY